MSQSPTITTVVLIARTINNYKIYPVNSYGSGKNPHTMCRRKTTTTSGLLALATKPSTSKAKQATLL